MYFRTWVQYHMNVHPTFYPNDKWGEHESMILRQKAYEVDL